MRSETVNYFAVWLLRVKFVIVAATPLAAYAAEQTIRATSASSLTPLTWTFIFGFSFLGWAVADLDKVAELWNLGNKNAYEQWKSRLSLAKTIAASVAAGLCMFFLGKLAPEIMLGLLGVKADAPEVPEMLLLIFTTGAGYMGARWFDWFEKKFLTK